MKYSIFIFLVLAACSPQKRLARIIANNPQLVKSDTIRSEIKIPYTVKLDVPEVNVKSNTVLPDSFCIYQDTLSFLEKNSTFRVFFDKKTNKIVLDGYVKPDSIIHNDSISAEVITQINTVTATTNNSLTWWEKILLALSGLLLFILGIVWLIYQIYKLFK